MLELQRKIPATGGSKEVQTRNAASSRTASPTHYRLSYCRPQTKCSDKTNVKGIFDKIVQVEFSYLNIN